MANNVITTESLQDQEPIKLPETPITTPTVSPNLTQPLLDSVALSEREQQAQELQGQGISQMLQDITGLQGQTQELAKQQDLAGVQDIKKSMTANNSRILQLQAELNQDDIQLAQQLRAEERRDTLLPFAQMGQAKIAGDAQIVRALKNAEIGVLNARSLALQGDLALALETAQQAVDVKYAPQKDRIETFKQISEVIKPYLTSAEAKKAKAMEYKANLAMAEINKAEEEEKNISAIAIEAAKNGASQDEIGKIFQAKSINEAITLAGPLLEKKNSQFVTLDNGNSMLIDQKTGKIIKSYGGAKVQDSVGRLDDGFIKTNFGSLINLTGNLESSVFGKESVKNELYSMLKDQDYQSAYAQVLNTVEDNLKGDVASRFANARNDVGVMTSLRDSIQKFASAGGDTGLLIGKPEEISRKLLGVSGDPELTSLAVQLQREFQTYRNIMTGAAFTPGESREYEAVNPTANKNINLNLAIIDGAINQLSNRIDATVEDRIPQAKQLKELAIIPVTSEQVKQTVNQVYANSSPEIQDLIDVLIENGRSDSEVIEYLQAKKLI